MRVVELAAQAAHQGQRLRATLGGGYRREKASRDEIAVQMLRPMLTQAAVTPATYKAAVRHCRTCVCEGATPRDAARMALKKAFKWERQGRRLRARPDRTGAEL